VCAQILTARKHHIFIEYNIRGAKFKSKCICFSLHALTVLHMHYLLAVYECTVIIGCYWFRYAHYYQLYWKCKRHRNNVI